MAAVTLADVTLGYNGHPAVHHLDGAFASGSLTAVIGPNGSGKSTLLKGIVGMLSPLGGRILRDVPATDIAYLPQSAEIDRSFPASVADIVAMGLWRRRGAFAGVSRADYADIEAALAAVGLIGFENRPLDTLSGGQMQRALFARVLLHDARRSCSTNPSPPSTSARPSISCIWSSAGTAKAAHSSPCCTMPNSSSASSRKPCCSPASPSPGAILPASCAPKTWRAPVT
jgi:hypothetical protein